MDKKLYYIIFSYLLFINLPVRAIDNNDLRTRYDSCCQCILKSAGKHPVDQLRCARIQIEIGEKLEDNNVLMDGYINTSRALYLLCQYPMALQYAHKALQLSSKHGYLDINAKAKRLCGAIYTNLNDIYNARKYLNEAIGYYEYQKDTVSLIRAMGTMAISLGENKQYEECIRTLNKVYKMAESQRDSDNMNASLHNLAYVYSLQNLPDEGIRILESMAKENPLSMKVAKNEVAFTSLMGYLFYQKGEYSKAKEILTGCIAKARDNYSHDELVSALSTLSDIAREEKDYQHASQYLSELLAFKDSVIGFDVRKKMEEMEVIYELAKKNEEIDHLNLQNHWNKKRLVFIMIIGGVIFAIIIIKIRSNAKVMASKACMLDKELEGKRSELMNIAIYYYELRSTISNLNKRLKQIYNKCIDEEIRKDINVICLSIAQSSTMDDTKARINNYIDTNYSGFIARLESKFPGLSDSEKRICAMLLIDYTTKEMADVLNISEKSIDNIRSRIRKKMDIPKDFSISKFLRNI